MVLCEPLLLCFIDRDVLLFTHNPWTRIALSGEPTKGLQSRDERIRIKGAVQWKKKYFLDIFATNLATFYCTFVKF